MLLLVGGAALAALAADRVLASAKYFHLTLILVETYPFCKFLYNSHNGVVLGNYPHNSKVFVILKFGGKLFAAITLTTTEKHSWLGHTVLLGACGLYYSLNFLCEVLTNKIVALR